MAGWNAAANEIFLQVLEHDTDAARQAHLDVACRDNPELRAEVESLLAAHADIGSFLETPVPGVADTTLRMTTEGAGTRLGPYKLLQQLGEGGMGVVYLAEQSAPVKRRVALKILRPGMDSRQIIARFEAEEQALALMDHPNIAKVLDAGTTLDGRPYFVMELVKGVPITDYCDQHRLTTKERLQLHIPVCQAVQHAHQKGIIHRDIKPSNVLVALYDGRPIPKVIDFGVAKATGRQLTNETMFTEFGQIIGTLEYMSPEQATLNQLDIDTRSDIYSLGVLLYELLTGCTPFDKRRLRNAAIEELMRIIREEEPPKPSTRLTTSETLSAVAANRQIEPRKLGALVRGELDWIVMKALEKNRSRRYETASAFANDIQRYLRNEPVEASPPSNAYRISKFARKHRALIGTTALIVLVLIAATGFSLRSAARARAASTAALNARNKAVEANRRAEERANLALRVITSMYEDIGWLSETAGLEDVRQAYITRAVDLFEQLEREQKESAEVRYYLGELSRQLASLYQDLGLYDEAEEYARQAVELFDRNIDTNVVRIDTHLPLARAASQLAYVKYLRSDLKGSMQCNEQSIRICEQLATAHPGNLLVLRQLRITLENLGSTLDALGRYDECESCRRRALDLSERLAVILPEDSETACALGAALHNLAHIHQRKGEGEEAKELLQRAVKCQLRSLKLKPDAKNSRRCLANHYHQLGRVMSELFHQPQEAADCYRQEMEYRQSLTSDFPRHLAYHLDLANCCNSLANVLRQMGDGRAALTTYQQAKELLDDLVSEFPENKQVQRQRAAALANVALLLQTTGEPQRALTMMKQAEQELRRMTWATSPQDIDLTARVLQWKAIMLWRDGQREEAVSVEKEAVEARRKLVKLCPTDIRQFAQLGSELHNLARLCIAQDSCAEAISLVEEAISWRRKVYQAQPEDKQSKSQLGNEQAFLAFCTALDTAGELDLDQAERSARESLALDPHSPAGWQSLGMVQYRNRQWQAASESLLKASELAAATDSFRAFSLAMSFSQLNQEAVARNWFDKAVSAMSQEQLFQKQLKRLFREASDVTGFTTEVRGSPAVEKAAGRVDSES